MRTGFAWLVALGFMLACSSGGSGGSSGGSGAAAGTGTAMCQAYCDWKVRCAKGGASCQADCEHDVSKNEGKLSSAYVSMFQSCFPGLACTQDEEACVANFGGADPAYPNIPEVSACMAKREECSQPTPEGDGGSVTQPSTAFADDYCLSIAALDAEARAQAEACRSQPCAGIRDCLIQAGAFNY